VVRGPPATVDLLVERGRRRPQQRIRLHHPRNLDPRDLTIRHGLRTTTPERALLDLADRLDDRALERLLDEAVGARAASPTRIASLITRSAGRHGAPRLAALLQRDYTARTRGEFERRLLDVIRMARLPHPFANHPVGPFVVDFLWPDARYAVEADSRAWHSTHARQKRDAAKDRHLRDLGIEVRRVRWWELADEPHALVAEIATTLASRSSR
jgi:very-short-patch-repair endonuclease